MSKHSKRFIGTLLTIGAYLIAVGVAVAASDTAPINPEPAAPKVSPMHPAFPLLDAADEQVQISGRPLSTMATCGTCHDVEFIAEHSLHTDIGYGELFGADAAGSPQVWAWSSAEDSEMNCLLCHTQSPDNASRVNALKAGDIAWANTATLANTELVSSVDGRYVWNAALFDEDGNVDPAVIGIQDPRNANCATCHGVIHTDPQIPLVASDFNEAWHTLTAGQIVSPQRMSSSGLNLANKSELTRTFDIHAERVLNCVDCHYSLNNPVFFQASATLDHLSFDPRRLDFGEYLYRPLHEFAVGQTRVVSGDAAVDTSASRCESCHNAAPAHADWLPYAQQHFDAMACETCHIPEAYGPALAMVDWTVLNVDGTPLHTFRNTEQGADPQTNALLTGYSPVLLPRLNEAGDSPLTPYNLVTEWYWVAGEAADKISVELLRSAFLTADGTAHTPEVVALLDMDSSGSLSPEEMRLETSEKVAGISRILESVGVVQPKIAGEVQPYALHHGVTDGQWVTKDCQVCHADQSRLSTPFMLADYSPGDAVPDFAEWDGVSAGEIESVEGALYYTPSTALVPNPLYVFGHDRAEWVDTVGILAFLGVLGGVSLHSGLRVLASRRFAKHAATDRLKRVYMYSVYERFWHWLQTAVIMGLLFTGLVIHRPEQFSLFSFAWTVTVHNILAAILVVNAALSLFYHVVSGEIRQYIPRPVGFFDRAILQVKYYLGGIFRNAPHPFEKVPDQKLNPLQQLTYLGILNVLLPLQIVTGILMWGRSQFPDLSASLGGLPFLAPFHSLVAWLFASFIVLHVYLTTTGHAPLANIQAMMLGWEGVESHDQLPDAEPSVTNNTQQEGV